MLRKSRVCHTEYFIIQIKWPFLGSRTFSYLRENFDKMLMVNSVNMLPFVKTFGNCEEGDHEVLTHWYSMPLERSWFWGIKVNTIFIPMLKYAFYQGTSRKHLLLKIRLVFGIEFDNKPFYWHFHLLISANGQTNFVSSGHICDIFCLAQPK